MRNYTRFLTNAMDILKADAETFDEEYWINESLKYEELKDKPFTQEELRETDRMLMLRLLDSHIFEMDDTTKKLLMLTNPPNRNEMFRLPFMSTFIDVEIKADELEKYCNIKKELIFKGKHIESIIGVLVYDQGISTVDGGAKFGGIPVGRGLFFYLILKGSDEKGTFYKIDAFFDNTNIDSLKPYCARHIHQKPIKNFVINFLNLINSPDVKLVHVTRDKARNIKRMKKGKLPLPSQCRIKLDGKLKVYVNQMQKNKKIWNYSFSFWVRGHWRTFRAKRYINKIGKRTWIPPYVKGKGILIKKDYEVDTTC